MRSPVGKGKLKRALGFRDLILFFVVSGLSLRWIATAAATAHPGLTLFKVVIMTLVLLTAGVAIYRSSRRAQQPDIAPR